MSDSSAAMSSAVRGGAWMVNGMRCSRAIVTMQTLRTAEAVRPTSSQKRVKSRLMLSFTEIVMFAMGKVPFLLCIWCVLYGNRSNAASVDGCLTDEPKKQVKRTRIIIIANGGTEFLQDIVALGTSRVFTHLVN